VPKWHVTGHKMQQICTAITDLPTYFIQYVALGLFFSLLRDNNDEKNSAEGEFARACWLAWAVSGLGQNGGAAAARPWRDAKVCIKY